MTDPSAPGADFPAEHVEGAHALREARAQLAAGREDVARRWALTVADSDDFAAWQGAAKLLDRLAGATGARRTARVALVGSFTTTQIGVSLKLAAARFGVAVELYEPAYGQYRQEILDPGSGLYAFGPDVVVIAVHHGDLGLPLHSDDPDGEVEAELGRWTSLWDGLRERAAARIIQWNFVVPDVSVFGHLAARLPGARDSMIRALDQRLGAVGQGVAVLDCERIASSMGKRQWFDERYWHLSKAAVSLRAVPELARHLAAVLAAELGLSRKCVVLDLDNTLWGGVIGEDGLEGIRLGGNAEGEAYVAFQEYLRDLQARGVLLAVCSKNNEADAREPFERHPEMRLRLDDISMFVANWESKPDQVRQIAQALDIGIDAVVFVDDNPVEREAMRQLCPEVEVVPLPLHPALYARAVAEHLSLEPASFTAEDASRTEQYRARAEAHRLAASASSLDEFLESLEMEAEIRPIAPVDIERVVQLLGKTNQFNLTTRRHGRTEVERFATEDEWVDLTFRLADRFTDHGLVSLLVARREGVVADIDTWLMSCRVIGRTVEDEMLAELCKRAATAGCTTLRGTYVPSTKNALVAGIFERFGFDLVSDVDGTTIWEYDIAAKGPITNRFIARRAVPQ